MKPKYTHIVVRLIIVSIPILFLISGLNAHMAANTDPDSAAEDKTLDMLIGQIAPSECSGLGLTSIHNDQKGGNANILVLGSSASDEIVGENGNDCLLGGNGDDHLLGGLGNDVCIVGPGTDTFEECETVIQ